LIMRLLLCVGVVVLAISLAGARKGGKKSSMLLGADDVDNKAAGMRDNKLPKTDTPQSLREVKKLTREDKQLIKELQNRLKTLKAALKDNNKSKGDKKKLKKQFRELKSQVHSKRSEFNLLKQRKSDLKHQKVDKKNQPRREGKGNRKKGGIIFADKTTAAATTTTTTTTTTEAPTPKPTTAATTKAPESVTARLSKADRKALKKSERQKNKKNKNKNKESLDMLMQADAPMFDAKTVSRVLTAGHKSKRGRKKSCESDSDCSGGASCVANRKGNKHCRGGNTDKAAGKKCHSSEQCARGLKCFVTHTTEQLTHKKHPRRGKGTCADPSTTDGSKGKFIPFKTTV